MPGQALDGGAVGRRVYKRCNIRKNECMMYTGFGVYVVEKETSFRCRRVTSTVIQEALIDDVFTYFFLF